MTEQDVPLTTGQVARLFNVTPSAVVAWANSGKLPFFRTPGGNRRFHRAEVEVFLAGGGDESAGAA